MAITFGAFYWDINCKLKCHQILLDNLNLIAKKVDVLIKHDVRPPSKERPGTSQGHMAATKWQFVLYVREH